jgi:hypothetical protein
MGDSLSRLLLNFWKSESDGPKHVACVLYGYSYEICFENDDLRTRGEALEYFREHGFGLHFNNGEDIRGSRFGYKLFFEFMDCPIIGLVKPKRKGIIFNGSVEGLDFNLTRELEGIKQMGFKFDYGGYVSD